MATPSTSYAPFVFEQPTRILVVDDDPLLQESARVYLSTAGAEVEGALDGEIALDLLRTKTFNIALIDIEMPRVGGFDLVERMRAQEALRDLPVIMLTVRGDPDSIDRAYEAGVTSYLQKPINWRQLAHQVQQLARTARKDSEARRPAPEVGNSRAQNSILARQSASQDASKSFQVTVGILIVVGLIMALLGAAPSKQRAATADCKPPHCTMPAGTMRSP
jgi:DNA-binding response OmpR family regulator